MARGRSVLRRVLEGLHLGRHRQRRPVDAVPFPEVEANARRQAGYGDTPSAP